jgi:hypothetical protein
MQETIEISSKVLKKIVESTVEGATGWWRDKSKKRDFFGRITRYYAEKMIERYNYVKVLGMHEPVPLKSLGYTVKIMDIGVNYLN